MKKITFLSLLFVSLIAHAAQISINEARQIAAGFFGTKIDDIRQANIRKAPGINKAYYIFTSEDNDAFVILSGETRMPQVLAYSHDNGLDLDDMPPQLPGFLAAYSEAYDHLLKTGVDILEIPKRKASPILYQTAKWGQNEPFNTLCPSSYTGCCATAMAIKMKYHNYPQRGKGSHSYENEGKTLSMDFNFDMNFSLMNTDFTKGSYNQKQADAVAKLMYACGVALNMQYGYYESWAYMTDVVKMAKYFGYSDDIEAICNDNVPNEKWIELLDNELDNVGPVIYRGADSNDNGGHIFLIDGRDNDKYHINWGWNGNYNGYFTLGNLKPGSYNYAYHHWMVINAKPEDSGKFTPIAAYPNISCFDLTFNKEKIVADDPFYACSNYIVNRDYEDHKGTVALALLNKSGKVREILKQMTFDLWASYTFPMITYTDITSSVSAENGDMLAMVYKLDNETEWSPVLSSSLSKMSVSAGDNKPQFVPVTWDLDPLISIVNAQGQDCDRALKNLPYTFVLGYDDDEVTDVKVIVNGEPLKGFGHWFTIPSASADSYAIKVYGTHTSVNEIINDTDGEVSIYRLDGVLLKSAPSRSAASEVLKSLPNGIYLLKANSKTERCIN